MWVVEYPNVPTVPFYGISGDILQMAFKNRKSVRRKTDMKLYL